MALETGTYISDLVVTNPVHTDGLNQADAHARLIKSTLQNTFPAVKGAVASSHTQIDAAVASLTNGNGVLADAGEFFKTNSKDGVTNPAAGQVALVGKNGAGTASAAVLTVHGDTLVTNMAGDADVAGNAVVAGNGAIAGHLTVGGSILGPGSCPIGGMIMWLDDNLPTDGVWAWANGGTLSRTIAGQGLELYTEWSRNGGSGTRYGTGDGVTTFNVINMQEVVPVGKSTMGGAASPALLPSVASAVKTLLGAEFGEDTHLMTVAELVSHFHTASIFDPGHNHTYADSNTNTGGGGTSIFIPISQTTQATSTSLTGVRVNSANGLDTTNSQGGSTPFNVKQPSRVVGFIIRIA